MKKNAKQEAISPEMQALLKLLTGPAVALPPSLTAAIGCPCAALIFRQGIFWAVNSEFQKPYTDKDGVDWFFCTAEMWQKHTGLNTKQQASGMKILKSCGFWATKVAKVPREKQEECKIGGYFSLDIIGFASFYKRYLDGEGSAKRQHMSVLSQKREQEKLENPKAEFQKEMEGVISQIRKLPDARVISQIRKLLEGGNFPNQEITIGGNFPNQEITHIYSVKESLEECSSIESYIPETEVSEGVCTPIFQIEIEEQKPSTSTQKKEEQDTRGAGGAAAEPGEAKKAGKPMKESKYTVEWPGWTGEVCRIFDEVEKSKTPPQGKYTPFNWQAGSGQLFGTLSYIRKAIEADLKAQQMPVTPETLKNSFTVFFQNGYDYLRTLKEKTRGDVVHYTPTTLYKSYNTIKRYGNNRNGSDSSAPTSFGGQPLTDEGLRFMEEITRRSQAIVNGETYSPA